MLTIGAPLCERIGCLLLLCSPLLPCALAQATNKTADAARVSASFVPANPISAVPSFADSTCPSRTINYITHTLPQQCLRTDWTSASEDGFDSHATLEKDTQTPTNQAVPEKDTPSTPVTSGAVTSTQIEPELETDSPLDNANFLSFEEWKKRNLVQAGQSPDSVGQGRANADEQRARRRPVNVNALDSLGEEGEIEIDFSGFGSLDQGGPSSSSATSNQENAADAASTADGSDKAAPSSWSLSKDAGKTYKERFNYASFDCAATVLKTNPKAKSTSSILVENKDSYMLTQCSADNKYIIVELCDDILIDTVVLANYEFFSSMFRHFRVSVSDRYPVKMDRWRVLGTFQARNSRDIQPFLIKEPQIWARYLRIEFLTHYGNEYYCPMSLLRVHGTTMIEQFRREEEQARGDDDADEPIEAVAAEPVQSAVPDTENDTAASAGDVPLKDNKDVSDAATQEPPGAYAANSTSASQSSVNADVSGPQSASGQIVSRSSAEVPTDTARQEAPIDEQHLQSTKSILPNVKDSQASEPNQNIRKNATAPANAEDVPPSSSGSALANVNSQSIDSTRTHDAQPTASDASGSSSVSSSKTGPESVRDGSQTQSSSHKPAQTHPNPATPSTQESVFKSIHKRLQYLEANSTLSLQYIEEQSRILRDAFMKVEKKQLQKTEKFLDHLNSTVMHELKTYRNMYDQLWQSTILELEGMKERQKTEVGEIGARLSMMADELVWQKRMAVVQSTLLLLCLGLVLFVRSGTLNPQPDVPIAQQLGRTYSSFFETPPHSGENPKELRRKRRFRDMWRSDTSFALSDRSGQLSDAMNAASDVETDGRRSPVNMDYSPPTPVTPGMHSGLGKGNGFSRHDTGVVIIKDEQDIGLLTPSDDIEEQSERLSALATQSGPATPRGSRDNRPSWEEVDRAVGLLSANEIDEGRRSRRSPLRRAESYKETTSDSLEDEDAEGYFVSR